MSHPTKLLFDDLLRAYQLALLDPNISVDLVEELFAQVEQHRYDTIKSSKLTSYIAKRAPSYLIPNWEAQRARWALNWYLAERSLARVSSEHL